MYRITPNKRPCTFSCLTASKRAFLPLGSFLRNENRTIFAIFVKKDTFWAMDGGGGAFIGRGRLLGVLRYPVKHTCSRKFDVLQYLTKDLERPIND